MARCGRNEKALREMIRGMVHVDEMARWSCEQVRERVDKLLLDVS
jgi:hypothetical protein